VTPRARVLLGAVGHEVRLQYRQGFYAVYAALSALYLGALLGVPPAARDAALPYLLFADPAAFGLIAVGALALLERRDRTLEALVLTPLGVRGHVLARAASLTLLALAPSVALAAALHPRALGPWLLLGVGLTAAFVTLVGLAMSSRFTDFNAFMYGTSAATAALCLPLLEPAGLWSHPALLAVPTHGSLVLLTHAFGRPAGAADLALAAGTLAAAVPLAFVWAERWIGRRVLDGR
jgi:fluoroquinolone transport system permease protein